LLQKKDRVIERQDERNSVFVDSSAWIAFFSRRDQNHQDADHLFRAALASKRSLFTTNLVLAEIHRLLIHRAGMKAAATALAKIESSPSVRIEFVGPGHHESAKIWLTKLQDQPITYTDAVSFAVLESAGCKEAMSYDQHFRRAGFSSPAGNKHQH
jgi:uncharacterized protein